MTNSPAHKNAYKNCCNECIQNLISSGLASYGRTWNLGWGSDKAKSVKIGQAAGGGGKAGPYLKEGGVLSYFEICEKISKENAEVCHDLKPKNFLLPTYLAPESFFKVIIAYLNHRTQILKE